jgi:hypothetical protein
MPQAANIVLADAQATPVNHTFIPIGYDQKGLFWFEDQSQSNPSGFWRVSVEVKRPAEATPGKSTDGRTYRTKIALHEPVMANVTNSTVSGVQPAPQVAYVMRSFTEFVVPERGTLQERKDISKMTPLLLQNALVRNVVEDLQLLY